MWTGVKCKFSSAHHLDRYVVGKLSNSRVQLWNFTRIGSKKKKVRLLISPARRLSEQPGLEPPQKGVNCNFSSPQFNKPYGVGSSQSRKLKYAVSAGLAKKIKNTALLIFLPEKFKNFHSTELYHEPLEGSTFFLYRHSTGHTALESCWLDKLKLAIFSRTGLKTKKSRRLKLFLSTVFKHGLLEGSTILLQYSAITHAPLGSSQSGKLKYAISPG